MEIRIYFEGKHTLRRGFKQFFTELEQLARQRNSTIEFVAAKDGPSDYRKALRAHPAACNILLKDSEGPMPPRPSRLCKQHGIDPALVKDVFWMVQLMESWFLADVSALETYYGKRFSTKAVGNTQDVESIPKAKVMDRLRHATTRTTKGRYEKIMHAPELLGRLNPALVQQKAPHCRKLFEVVRLRLNSTVVQRAATTSSRTASD